ncbi:S8 family serine peptidase [Tenacibaculum xiamenense]|uniref:S8 family serine peptidase n=1 Tax=Tenacibaculum xiamenense TaxID=1261553 RepID=UPI003893434A
MKNVTKFIFCASLMALVMTSCQNENSSNENMQSDVSTAIDDKNIIPGQYIVLFKESKITSAAKQLGKSVFTDRKAKAASVDRITEVSIKKINTVLADNNIDRSKVLNYYTTKIAGMAVKLTDEEFDKLAKDENVEAIDFDRIVQLPEFEVETVTTESDAQRAPQTTPCGINRAGGYTNASGNTWVWVIDTGIDLDHPDLNVVTNSTYAKSFAGGSANDCNGHGTHVAGTAAAKNNGFGVVGVSAGAPVVPVKVLGCNGSGSSSGILAGINHVGRYDIAGDVANLSLGGYHGSGCSTNSAYRSALTALSNGGTYVSLAAGNSRANAAYYAPACINGSRIYTVASMTCSRGFSSFSNYNMNPIDCIATGSNVNSTYLNGGYATLSGTSMAAPHVAGIMHARGSGPRFSGSVSHRGESYPIAVR